MSIEMSKTSNPKHFKLLENKKKILNSRCVLVQKVAYKY